MDSNGIFCNLSFPRFHLMYEGVGMIDIRVKHRDQLTVETVQGWKMAVNITSPEAGSLFSVPVYVFHLPLLRQVYVSAILKQLNLRSAVFDYVNPRMVSFMEEVAGRSGGYGFWVAVEMEILTVKREDGVDDLSEYMWREMEGGGGGDDESIFISEDDEEYEEDEREEEEEEAENDGEITDIDGDVGR